MAQLSWILMWGAAAILLLVLALLAVALFGPDGWRRRLSGSRTVIAGGLVFPIATLFILLVVGLTMTASLGRAPADAMKVRVTGYRWWWGIDYAGFSTANELVVPVGTPVVLDLVAADVIHSFWVPQLAGKRDMIPGKVNRLTIQADRAGSYLGLCAEYCGGPHALMQFRVHALEPAAYRAWEANQRRPAAPAVGEALFHGLGCGGCHRIAGTRARGIRGPDLTHVASRETIGAGILRTSRQSLRDWTENAHRAKPGVNMPAFDLLPPRDLDALADYMSALK